MNQKKYIIAAIVALIVGVNVYILASHKLKNSNKVDVFSAISQRTAMFLYTENIDSLKLKLDSLSYKNKLETSDFLNQTIQEISDNAFLLDSFKKILPKYNDVIIAMSHIGSSKLGFLSAVSFNDYVSEKKISQYFKSNKHKLSNYNFQDFKIYAVDGFNENKIQFTSYNNLLIFSTNGPLLEEALNAISTEKSKKQNALFNKLLAKKDFDADLHLFIDHTQNDLESVIEKKLKLAKIDASKKISDWSYVALNFNDKKLHFTSNFSYFDINKTSFSELLKSEAGKFTLASVLPNNTAYFEAISSKNNASFKSNEAAYEYIKDWLDDEAAYFCLETFDEDYLKRVGLVLKAKNIDTAKVNMYLLNKEMAPVSNFEGVAIYEMNTKAISGLFKNNLFSLSKPFFIFINDAVVFSDEINVLRTFIQKTKEKKFLTTNKDFELNTDSISNKLIYLNPQRCFASLNSLFQENFLPKEIGVLNINFFKQNNEVLASGNINFETSKANKTNKIWRTVLDTTSSFKPQLVINADNLRKEIITQDDNNTIYLINQSGEIILKKPFEAKIESEIYQIDLYKANKLYYVFNTKTHIYVMKRNGTVLDGYPIKLPAEATNGLLVVNYDKAKKYRFFVACANNKIYGYQANGKPLKGWSPLPGNFGTVSESIAYTIHDERDYIYFHNKKGDFYAFNRKGDKRFNGVNLATPFTKPFERFKNGFINLSEGSVYKIDFKGKTTAKILGDSTYTHFTNYEKKDAFAIATNQEFRVAKSKWTILGKRRLNDIIMSIESVVIKNKTWFLVEGRSSTYLINDLGEIHKDFPMLSTAKARITNFYSVKNHILLLQEGNDLNAFELVVLD